MVCMVHMKGRSSRVAFLVTKNTAPRPNETIICGRKVMIDSDLEGAVEMERYKA